VPAGQLSARARAARGHQSGTARPPAGLIPPAAVGATFLMLPTVGLLVRMPWSGLRQIFADSDVLAALRLSLICSTATTVVSLLLGIPLAWVLARSRFPGLGALRTVVTLPLVLPPVAGGVALFLAFGRYGLVGLYLDRWFGLTIPFTVYGVIVAETFVSMPFLVVTVAGALRGADQGTEEAAATLGATPLRIFATITLPGVLPSVGAGAVLCWARALGEFGATITFNGSLKGVTETMPVAVSQALNVSPQAAEGLSLVLLVIAVVILAGLRDRWLRPLPSA
jgi:molybdate transport system permease protein